MGVVKIEIPEYSPDRGFKYNWENGFDIKVKVESGEVKIIANKAGLFSLANHLLNLAQEDIPSGYHLHFDEDNSLEEGSSGLVIQKK